jgi:phage terminase small subunit
VKQKTPTKVSKSGVAQRYEHFVRAYIGNGHNATQAALAAGYSESTAASQGARLLKNVHVRRILKKLESESNKVAGLEAGSVKTELARIVFFNIKSIFDEAGRLIPIHKLPAEVTAGIGSMKFDKGGQIREVRAWDKGAGIERAMKHLGLFERDNKQQTETRVLIIPAKMPPGYSSPSQRSKEAS